MGLFSAGRFHEPADVPEPISRDRLVALLEGEGWNYFVDNEGDLGGNWDSNLFYFMIRGSSGQLLHVQAMWHSTPDMNRLEEVRLFIETWHRERLWPKCFHRITDEGRIRVFTEHNVDFEHGATDDQFLQQVQCALSTSTQFFDALTEELGL